MDTGMLMGADMELQGVEHWDSLADRPFGLPEASASLDPNDPEVIRKILLLDTEMRVFLHGILDRYRPGQRLRLLSVGCGTANEEAYLAALHEEVVGVDFSPKMRKRARAQAVGSGVEERLHIIHGTATRLTAYCERKRVPKASFDVVILGRILMHIMQEPRRVLAITQALEMLRPGGMVLMYEPILDFNPDYSDIWRHNRGIKNDHTLFWDEERYDVAFIGTGRCGKLGADANGKTIHHMSYLGESYDFLLYERP